MSTGLTGTMSSHMVRLILDAALRLGVSPGEVTHLPGLEPTAVPDDLTRIPTSTGVRLWELIARQHGTGAGLEVAATAALGRMAVWDLLFTTGPTLADGCRAASEYLPVVTDPVVAMRVVEDDRLLTLAYDGETLEPEVEQAINEFALGVLLQRARDVKGPGIAPVHLTFSNPAPRNHQRILDAFGTSAIDFRAPSTSITFLDAEAHPAQPKSGPEKAEMDRILRRYADLTMNSARPAPAWRDTFRMAVASALAEGDLSLEEVAGRLLLSPRTLQRRLGELGTTWREETETVRHEQAVTLLRETELPIRAIASRLGYADARALARAFARWTGKTPDGFRRDAAPLAG